MVLFLGMFPSDMLFKDWELEEVTSFIATMSFYQLCICWGLLGCGSMIQEASSQLARDTTFSCVYPFDDLQSYITFFALEGYFEG